MFQYPEEAYCQTLDDVSCITKFYVVGAENSLEQLKNYLTYTPISCSGNDNCLRYTIDVYCKNGTNKSTAVCKDLIESDGAPLLYQDDNVASCSSPVELYGASAGFSNVPITVLYDIKNKSVSFSSTDTVFTTDDSFSYNGNSFYLKSIDGNADTFKKVEDLLYLRNLVGCHFNEWSLSLSQSEAEDFGKAVLDLYSVVYDSKKAKWIESTNDLTVSKEIVEVGNVDLK